MSVTFSVPFPTRENKAKARSKIILANVCANAMQEQVMTYGCVTPICAYYAQKSDEYMNEAAQLLGFKNLLEMNRHMRIHGRLY